MAEKQIKKIFVSCGELSGENHLIRIVNVLKDKYPDIELMAMASDRMSELGVEVPVNYQDYSFVGFTDVLMNIFKVFELKDKVMRAIQDFQPDLLLMVDYGGFHMEIAKTVHDREKLGILGFKRPEIVQFIAPQIWASRPHRIKNIKKYIDKVLCTLPFEPEIYDKAGVENEFVGNPVLEQIIGTENPSKARDDLHKVLKAKGVNIDEGSKIIGVFPGSRSSELHYLLAPFIEAAQKIKAKYPKTIFVIAKAPNIAMELLQKKGLTLATRNLFTVVSNEDIERANQNVMQASDALWLCSGTATFEAALYAKPFFLCYKGNFINYALYKFFKTIDKAGLPNIIAGKYLVKEFLQYEANSQNFVTETEKWFDYIQNKIQLSEYYFDQGRALMEFRKGLSGLETSKLVVQSILKDSPALVNA